MYYRYCESEQVLPALNDPYAGLFLSQTEKNLFQQFPSGETTIARTCLIDRLLKDIVSDGHIDLVVNLGCGMDCRPYRLDLPSTLTWWDVDFPQLLQHKAKVLQSHKPVCQLERIALDLLNLSERKKIIDRMACEAKHAVIITEGVLIYLHPGQVTALVRDLVDCTSIRYWISDVVSPDGLLAMNAAFDKLFSKNVEFKFAMDKPIEYFTSLGWNKGSFHSLMEKVRIRRNSPINWAYYYYSHRIQNHYQSMAGVMLLEK